MKILAILFCLAALFTACWLFGGGAANHPDLFGLIPGYRSKATDDAVAQYNLAKQQGDQAKPCEQAGVVRFCRHRIKTATINGRQLRQSIAVLQERLAKRVTGEKALNRGHCYSLTACRFSASARTRYLV